MLALIYFIFLFLFYFYFFLFYFTLFLFFYFFSFLFFHDFLQIWVFLPQFTKLNLYLSEIIGKLMEKNEKVKKVGNKRESILFLLFSAFLSLFPASLHQTESFSLPCSNKLTLFSLFFCLIPLNWVFPLPHYQTKSVPCLVPSNWLSSCFPASFH